MQPAPAKQRPSEVIVNGRRVPACPQGGGAQGLDYACLNRQLQGAAVAGGDAASAAPDAASAVTSQANTPSKVGTFSYSATHQRLGSNFGHSVQPQRPPAPTYTNPIRPGAGPR